MHSGNDISDAEVVVTVDDTAAPISETAECTRESLLKPPDWRYQEAIGYLGKMRRGVLPTMPSDPVVQYVIRGLKGSDTSGSDLESAEGRLSFLQAYWPVLSTVLCLGTFMRHSAMTSQIEVCLIKGWDHEMASTAGCPVGREIYDLYSSVFFDLTGTRAVHAWMQDYLFEPERYNSNPARLRSLLMAYHGSGTSGMNAMVTGCLTRDENGMLKQLMKNERQKALFDYIVKHTKLDPQTYTTLMETALKNMTEHDFQEHMKDRDDAGTGSIEELATNLETAIKVYSQEEVANYNQAGVDFSNQYTQSLIER